MAGEGERVLLAHAAVLHRRAYQETSLLVDVFAADHGRLRLIAKGARRGRNAQAQLLQPFMPLRLSWAGRGELPTLTAVESAGNALALDGAALFCGFYMNELLLHLLPPHDPSPPVFQLYFDALRQLRGEPSQEKVLRFFELSLLEEIGYGLSLDREARGWEIDPAKNYSYIPDQGPVESDGPGVDSVRGSTLLGLQRKHLDTPDEWREAKQLMRRVIRYYLNGRALKSRDLFKPFGKATHP
ncbi:DNA repair protein RecO [Methylomagnum sp.]